MGNICCNLPRLCCCFPSCLFSRCCCCKDEEIVSTFSLSPAPTMSYSWVPCSMGKVHPGAVIGGQDCDGDHLYVGRAFHGGDLLPCKIAPLKGRAYVCYAGQEHEKYEYEVLCSNNIAWMADHNGHIPVNAIPAGTTENGEKLYIGRVMHQGTLTPGKVQHSHSVCYIPYAGQEIASPEYEILIHL